MQLKVKRVTLAAELPLKFGLSLLEGNVPKIRETAHNGIRIFPKPEKLTATPYFYASAFIAYEHFPSIRDPLTMIQFIELNDQTVNKADIRKSCTHIKKQLKAYELENPYFLVFHYLYHCLWCNTNMWPIPQGEWKANHVIDAYFRVALKGIKSSSKVNIFLYSFSILRYFNTFISIGSSPCELASD